MTTIDGTNLEFSWKSIFHGGDIQRSNENVVANAHGLFFFLVIAKK